MSPVLTANTPSASVAAGAPGTVRLRLSRFVAGTMEFLVLAMVVLSPWAFGCIDVLFEMVLFLLLAVLLGLWAVRMLLEGRLIWASCPVLLCLMGLFFLGVWQITPLSSSALQFLSPKTQQLTRRLLPETPERLPGGATVEVDPLAAGATISLIPATTLGTVVRLLGVVALYAVVRSGIASPGSFRRLAFAALINDFLLALLGLLQFFSSPHDLVYWTYYLPHEAFGPMMRNEFACYLNLCIGLGLGLLLSGRADLPGRRAGRFADPGWRGLLSDPLALWVGAALALMAAALLVCLSRGGFISFVGASLVCLVLAWQGSARFSRVGGVVLAVGLGLALVVWFGAAPVQKRLATLWPANKLEDDRFAVWMQTLPSAADHPLWGAGYGTFPYLEQMSRPPRARLDVFYDHAHNCYLEMFLEGGGVGLALSLLLVGFALRQGCRGFFRHFQQPSGSLALGGVFAFTALAVHALVDYPLYIPAITTFAVVLTAQMSALADQAAQAAVPRPSKHWFWRAGGCFLGVAAVGVVAAALWHEAAGQLRAERYRLAALVLQNSTDPAEQAKRISYLQAATSLSPQDARSHLALAETYLTEFNRQAGLLQLRQRLIAVNGTFLCGAAIGTSPSPWSSMFAALTGQPAAEQLSKRVLGREKQRLERDYQIPAMARYLQARNLNPLLERAHIRLAGLAKQFETADPPPVHLDRARLLIPYNAQLWYLSGLQDLERGDAEHAWEKWRRSLGCSGEQLREILKQSIRHLPAEQVVARVMPDDPALLWEAAGQLQKQGVSTTPFLQAALNLLERQKQTEWSVLVMKAQIYAQLNQPDQALAVFEEVLGRAPSGVEWRYQFAQLLYDRGRLDEARRQLRTILDQQPEHKLARELYQAVVLRIAEGDK